jgi:hypothetical protein
MQLASSFRYGSPMLRADSPLSDDQIRHVAPSIFADGKHESRSERYTYIPTIDVLRGLRNEGFQPFMVCQTRVRDEGKREYTKHMLRLRHADQIIGDEANEIVLLNSHDGTSSYQMLAGVLRFVCQNGMVAGDSVRDIRVPHKGNIVQNVINGAFDVLDGFDLIREQKDGMRAVELNRDEQHAFARAALRPDRCRGTRPGHRKPVTDSPPFRGPTRRPLDGLQPRAGKPHEGRPARTLAQRTRHVHSPHHRHRPEREAQSRALDAR